MAERSYSTRREHTCRVTVEAGAVSRLPQILGDELAPPRKVAVISDRNVASFHLDAAVAVLEEAGYEAKSFLVPPGEESKSLKMLGNLWDRLLAMPMERDGVVVALGGGMVGDLAGLCASTLLRGVPVIQVPTSLLAQVDSAVGGKTGINRSAGKNLVGTFYQPHRVVVDPELLATLPEREFRAGLGEVIKCAMIRSPGLLDRLHGFAGLEELRESEGLVDIIGECLDIKVKVVVEDERESGVRAHLNFGHTIGHAIEAAESYQGLLHGEAVGIGMIGAAFLGVDLGLTSPDVPALVSALLAKYGLPVSTEQAPKVLLPFVEHDKKRARGQQRWVIVHQPGEVSIQADPPTESVLRALDAIHRSA